MAKIKKTQYLDFTHARSKDQIELMEKIVKDGVCPFCSEHFKKYHPRPILKETKWWIVSENMHPYEGARVHLLFVYKEHVSTVSEMKPEAGKELIELVSWAIQKYKIAGGAFFMRFGDTRYTGSSVNHLHAQLLTGNAKSDDDNIDKLKVKLGYKKAG